MTGGNLTVDDVEFESLKPRLMLLLEMYRDAGTEEARASLAALFQDVFLAAAWNVATDLLENGWQPTRPRVTTRPQHRLRLVEG